MLAYSLAQSLVTLRLNCLGSQWVGRWDSPLLEHPRTPWNTLEHLNFACTPVSGPRALFQSFLNEKQKTYKYVVLIDVLSVVANLLA